MTAPPGLCYTGIAASQPGEGRGGERHAGELLYAAGAGKPVSGPGFGSAQLPRGRGAGLPEKAEAGADLRDGGLCPGQGAPGGAEVGAQPGGRGLSPRLRRACAHLRLPGQPRVDAGPGGSGRDQRARRGAAGQRLDTLAGPLHRRTQPRAHRVLPGLSGKKRQRRALSAAAAYAQLRGEGTARDGLAQGLRGPAGL